MPWGNESRQTSVCRYQKLNTNHAWTVWKENLFSLQGNLVEEIIPSDSNVWNHWPGYGNSGMDAVTQANDNDKTRLSNGHRKQPPNESFEN